MNEEDFKRDVFPLKNKIFRFAKSLLTIHAEAEDATQDVFIKLWSKKNELTRLANIEAYAMTVTRNACLDKLKSQKHQPSQLPGYDLPAQNSKTDSHAEQTNQRTLVNKIINALPEQQKIVVHLRDVEGYEFEEIAEITGLNMNAVRVNLSRGRKTIREELTKMYNYGL